MRRPSIFAFLAIFLAHQVFAATPVLLQVKNDLDWSPYVYNTNPPHLFASGDTFVDQLPNPVGANNLVVELIAVDDTTSYPTIADSLGLTWTRVATCKDTTNGEDMLIYSAQVGATGGIDTVTTTLHAATTFTTLPALAEFAFAGALDGTAACANGATTTVAAGSFTPTQSGDLAVQFAWNDTIASVRTGGCDGVHYTQGSQSNITWQKFLDGHVWCFGGQWGVYNSTAALNPTFTISTAGFVTTTAFFAPNVSGTPQPSGIRVIAEQQQVFSTIAGFNSTTQTTYFPCPSSANLMVAEWTGPGPASTYDMTAVSDSNLNTWTSNHAEVVDSNSSTALHTYSAANATASTGQTVTVTLKAASADLVNLYCIEGAAPSSPLDVVATNSGNQTVAGDNTLVSITPSVSNDLVLLTGSQTFNTTRSFTGANQAYNGCFWSNEDTNLDGCAANNAWGSYYAPNTSAITWTAHQDVAGTAVSWWTAEADAYKAAAGAPSTTPPVWVIQPMMR